jgi:hypothetical protein
MHKDLLSPEYDDYRRMFGKDAAKRIAKRKALAFPGFENCLKMMRSKNAMVQEDGFHFLAPHASGYLDELIAALQTEEDRGLRSWLLELIGEAKALEAFPVLVKYLYSSDDMLRRWATKGLEKLSTTSEGRRLLWEVFGTVFEQRCHS